MKKNKGRLALVIVAIIWGSGFVASALALDYFTSFQILALRFTLAFIGSLIVYRKELINHDKDGIKKGIIIGIVLYLAFMFQTIGLVYTIASKNAFLTATNIVIVPFLSFIILRERINKNEIIGSIVTLIGIGLLTFNDSKIGSINVGDIFTLICALFFALQILLTDYFVKDASPGILVVSQMGTASLIGWLVIILFDNSQFNVNIKSICPILYLGLASTLLAYGIQTWAQKRVDATEAAIILSSEALFGMIASAIILKEPITINLLIGGFLILAGIVIVQLKQKNNSIYHK